MSIARRRRTNHQKSRRAPSAAKGVSRKAGSWKSQHKSPALLMKLGRRIKTSGALRRVLQYISNPEKALLVDTNLVGGHHKAWLSEINHDGLRCPRVREVFVHFSLSLNPVLRALRAEWWVPVIRQHLAACGFDGCSFVAFRHLDTPIDHVHVLVSRLRGDGKLVRIGHNFYRWREALRATEKLLGLTDVSVPRPSDEPDATLDAKEAPVASDRDQNARQRAKRRGTTNPWVDVGLVNGILSKSLSLDKFRENLGDHGIELDVATTAAGLARGLKYRQAGSDEWLSGSSLDRSLSIKRVIERIDRNAAEMSVQGGQSFSFRRFAATVPQPQEFSPDFSRPRGG